MLTIDCKQAAEQISSFTSIAILEDRFKFPLDLRVAMRGFSLTAVIFGCVSQYVLSQTVYKTEYDLGKDKVTGSEKETGTERTWKRK